MAAGGPQAGDEKEGERRLRSLVEAAECGAVHTVRICYSDHYGRLRGRRLNADVFLADARAHQAFCNAALVWSVNCEVFEETKLSNFSTGYPDMYAHPDLATLAPAPSVEGEYSLLCDLHELDGSPVFMDPRHVLRSVTSRLGPETRVGARLMLRLRDDGSASWAPGYPAAVPDGLIRGLRRAGLSISALQRSRGARTLSIQFAADDPIRTADALIVARSAAAEIAMNHDVTVTTMPREKSEEDPLRLVLSVESLDAAPGVDRRLEDLSILLAPLAPSYPRAPRSSHDSAAATTRIVASSDACPYLAIAGSLAAVAGPAQSEASAAPIGFEAAIDRYAGASWAREWFDPRFSDDTLALARSESLLRATAITDWDLARYRESI